MVDAQQNFTVDAEHHDWSCPLGQNGWFSGGRAHDGQSWAEGAFYDTRGAVDTYSDEEFTSICMIHDGRVLRRSWSRGFGRNTIVKLCRAFLTEYKGEPE